MAPAVAAIGAGAAIVGTGIEMYGMYKQNEADNNTRMYNAQVADRNAQYAKEQAGYLKEQAGYLETQAVEAEHQGQVQETSFRRNLSVLVGSQRAGYGASGAVVGEGSSAVVLKDTQRFGEEDAMTIRHNAAVKAAGIRREALVTTREAKRYIDIASDYDKNAYMLRNNMTSAALPMLGAGLTGASRAASNLAKTGWFD